MTTISTTPFVGPQQGFVGPVRSPFPPAPQLPRIPRPPALPPKPVTVATNVPFWNDAETEWTFAALVDTQNGGGGFQLPGIADVEVSREQKMDVKATPGSDGVAITFKGCDAAVVTIRLTMWHPKDWEAYQKCIAKIEPRPGKQLPPVFELVSAPARARNVRHIVIGKIDGPSMRATGEYELVISAREWFPQPKKSATKSITGTGTASLTNTPIAPGLPRAGVQPLTPANVANNPANQAARRAP